MTITLWGRRSSSNVQKAVWALEELGIPYDQIELGGPHKGLDSADYLRLNPNGLVPTLMDGDLVVWESHAILRYLSAAYASGLLWPTDNRARAIADQWTDWTATTFQPAWLGPFWLIVRTPPAQQDQQAIAAALVNAFKPFEILDRQLARTPYLAGDEFTYADIAAGVSMYRWTTMPIERPVLANVEAWHQRLLARPAFQKAVCVSYAELVGKLKF
jgi:glutathione S-transferase